MARGDSEDLPDFLTPGDRGVAQAAQLLRAGEVVALPTETVYGLAANALDEKAGRKIFAIKGRPLIDPLIVHGLDVKFLERFAHFTPMAKRLAEACWPGPLTLVLRRKPAMPKLVTAGRETVAVRSPAHPVMRAVLAACRLPLAAPSANPFGYISPTRAEHVRASLGELAPWIVDGGSCAFGLESTIVDVSDEQTTPRILRPGPITAEALANILGQPIGVSPRAATAMTTEKAGLRAPGMLPRHYSPRTRLKLLASGNRPTAPQPGRRAAWMRLSRRADKTAAPKGIDVFWLSETGDLMEAGRSLYDLLRRLDEAGYQCLWCETAPAGGLGAAVNDRLRRAAAAGTKSAKK